MRRYVIGGLLLALTVLIAGGLWLRGVWLRPLQLPEAGYVLRVEAGTSLGRLSRDLHADGILPMPRLFDAVARLRGADSRIRHGEYRVPAGSTAGDLLRLLLGGETIRYLVTLPEGIRLREALHILQRAEGIDAVLESADDLRLRELVGEAPSPEGFFLAETYQYERGATDLDVLSQAHRLAREALQEAWAARDPSLPYARPYEALIMASIIEKETAVPEERPQIAGVFVRRLQRDMRLQTDPTVIYGLGEAFDGNLTRDHLRDESNPYNTYRHKGLPPGPIALPGRAAIEAAVHPAGGDFLYFVARGDGRHEFSATLEQHEAAVRAYQLRRRADYRSTPQTPR